MRQPKAVYALDQTTGVGYVRVDVVMGVMIAAFDCLPFTFFNGNTTRPYITITTAIDWVRRELKSCGRGRETDSLTAKLAALLVAEREWKKETAIS